MTKVNHFIKHRRNVPVIYAFGSSKTFTHIVSITKENLQYQSQMNPIILSFNQLNQNLKLITD